MTIGENHAVAVIGAGTKGRSIAAVAAIAGHCVTIIDGHEDALLRSREAITATMASQVKRGMITPETATQAITRTSWSSDLSDCAGASLAIEAIIERETEKSALFAELEAILSANAIIATNTSSLSVERMANKLVKPERLIGLHFFNPVPAMKLVEIVESARNPLELLQGMKALMIAWGKLPVLVRDVPGFIVNRVARPYYSEGFEAVRDAIRPCDVDALLESSGSFRMGPLALSDLIGHDVNYAVACSIYEAYSGATRFRPSELQHKLVQDGELSKKSGRGFFEYGGPAFSRTADQPVLPPLSAPSAVLYSPDGSTNALVERLRGKGINLLADFGLPAGHLKIGEIRVAWGDGRPLGSRSNADVLMDYMREPGTAAAVGITSRQDSSFEAVSELLAHASITAIRLPDTPGQLVLRTLAQLANAAFDAFADKVADATAIDLAMQFGANHPEGPISWATRFGKTKLSECLRNIALATRDPIYAPTPPLEMDCSDA